MQPTVIIVGPTILDRDILTIDVTGLPHAAIECSELLAPGSGRAAVEESDNRHRLLRTRRERPSGRRAAEQRDERAPVMIELHAIPHEERGRTAGYRIGGDQSAGSLRPSPVRAMISSRSNSASPPSTVSMRRPCGVVVLAQASPRDLKPAPALPTAASTLSRSRVERASR